MKRLQTTLAALALAATLAPAAAFAQSPTGTLRTTGGGTLSIAQMRGRVVVLLFGGTIDPQSPEELPALQKLASRYAGRAVDVYWVSLDPASTADADLAGFANRNGYRGTILRDAGDVLRSVSSGHKPQLPTVVVLDASGAVAGRPVGGFDRDVDFVARLAAIVDPLLK
jgi:hypothetical protein